MITVKEAAAELGMSERFVYRLCAKGQLESFKLGRNVRISRQALRDYREAQKKRTHQRSVDTPTVSSPPLQFLRLRRN